MYKNWSRSGILYVSDCIDRNGKMMNEQQLYHILQNHTNWIAEYVTMRNIVNKLIEFMDVYNAEFMRNHGRFNLQMVTKNTTYNIMSLNSRIIYTIMVDYKFKTPIAQIKWQNNFELYLLEKDWQEIYICKIINMPDKKLAQFNFKLLNNIIVSKDVLCKWRRLDDNKCIYCGEIETVKHIYFDCCFV